MLLKVGDHQLVAADLTNRFKQYTGTELPKVEGSETVKDVNVLDWKNLDLSKLEFEIALVSANTGEAKVDDDIVFGTVNVAVEVPTLVTLKAAQTVTEKYVNGTESSANIVGALAITDKYGNDVYNPYAAELTQIFRSFTATLKNGVVQKPVTIGSTDFFNVYDMTVTAADKKDVKVYLDGTEISQSQVAFEYVKATGEITLTKENMNLQGDVEFHVPVKLTYLYDNYGADAQTVTAVVKFSKNATAGGDSSYATPWGQQWTLPAEVAYNLELAYAPATSVLDLGHTNDGKMSIAVSYEELYGATLYKNVWNTMSAFSDGASSQDLILEATSESAGVIKFAGDALINYSNYNGTTCDFEFVGSMVGGGNPYKVSATVSSPVSVTSIDQEVRTPLAQQWVVDAAFGKAIGIADTPVRVVLDLGVTMPYSSMFAASQEDIYGAEAAGVWMPMSASKQISVEVTKNVVLEGSTVKVYGEGYVVLTEVDMYGEVMNVQKIPYTSYDPYTSVKFDFEETFGVEGQFEATAPEDEIALGGGIAM